MTRKRLRVECEPTDVVASNVTTALHLKLPGTLITVNSSYDPWLICSLKINTRMIGSLVNVVLTLTCKDDAGAVYRFKVNPEKANYAMILDTVGLIKRIDRMMSKYQTVTGLKRGEMFTHQALTM